MSTRGIGVVLAAALVAAVGAGEAQRTSNSVGMPLVAIAPGDYLRGGSAARSHPIEELPAHRVRISRPFLIGATEVTRDQWQAVMGAPAPDLGQKGVDGGHPAVGVSWFDALAFCAKLSAKEGRTYRLPTEAEWEYACRAGSADDFAFGNGLTAGQGHFRAPAKGKAGDETDGATARCGSTAANAWGLHDTHGNAYEWCYDWFDGEHYLEDILRRFYESLPAAEQPAYTFRATLSDDERKPAGMGSSHLFSAVDDTTSPPFWPTRAERQRRPETHTPRLTRALAQTVADPLGPERGNLGRRAVRGGSWRNQAGECRSAARRGADPAWRCNAIGFRVVCETAPGIAAAMKIPPPPGMVEVAGFGRLPAVWISSNGDRYLLVKPGRFTLGLRHEEAATIVRLKNPIGVDWQRRQVQVRITKPFYLSNREQGPSQQTYPTSYRETLPASPSYFGAVEYATWLSQREGRRYRLVTNAEWEYAARAGTATPWPWGATMEEGVAVHEWTGFLGCNAPKQTGIDTHQSGRKLPNPWGFYDMGGSKVEHVADFSWSLHGRYFYPEGVEVVDPTGPTRADHERLLASGLKRWQLAIDETLTHLGRGGTDRHDPPLSGPGMVTMYNDNYGNEV